MKHQFYDNQSQGKFILNQGNISLKGDGFRSEKRETINTIAYNSLAGQQVTIDQITYTMPQDTILPLVANQHFVFEKPENIVAWQFNRDFYCIADHDAEVGCVGFLFYGIQHPFFVHLTPEEAIQITAIEKFCIEELAVTDKMQGEMLRTLLKRLIIKITRIAKKQTDNYTNVKDDKMDIIREFNLLLECNFTRHHDVQFYASAMNKSPKTLSNIFGLFNYPPPSKLIQNRIIIEAKRYLNYTNKSAKEVAAGLGFISPSHFSRFFKLYTGINFSEFKNRPSHVL